MKKILSLAAIATALTVIGCGDPDPVTDGGIAIDSPMGDVDAQTPDVDAQTPDVDAFMPPTDAGPPPDCAEYCTAIMANCDEANAMYPSMDACMGSCDAFEVGVRGATSGNTLGCRVYHAGAAEADPATHCRHAGPGGDGACGMNCEGFCAIALDACVDANEQFADLAECMTVCAGYPTDPAYSTAATGGDSFACRLYHLTVASSSMMNANMHCDHIPEDSMPCGG